MPPEAKGVEIPLRREVMLSALSGMVALGNCSGSALAAERDADVFARAPALRKRHKVVLLIASDDERVMRHSLGYSVNLKKYYQSKGEEVTVEIVANGSGIKVFRADTSPIQVPLIALRNSFPDIQYSICNSSKMIAESTEGHPISFIPGATLVPFGIGRLVDLQEAGWTYVHA
jgi:intracellular sulfur oxidation DsrE/DsrF family protein